MDAGVPNHRFATEYCRDCCKALASSKLEEDDVLPSARPSQSFTSCASGISWRIPPIPTRDNGLVCPTRPKAEARSCLTNERSEAVSRRQVTLFPGPCSP
ncbi:hypothetical protein T4A_2090 [Trichinella pseudospiralis]|uniref:Uncharacterized protein n=1 Tax=Trichinella pseudospiralis TaxID=6337 RepID=A0A0V1ED37_TRIPS|nr:hypothetical protein T4A_2090 [Trichinella pseudospiralis]